MQRGQGNNGERPPNFGGPSAGSRPLGAEPIFQNGIITSSSSLDLSFWKNKPPGRP